MSNVFSVFAERATIVPIYIYICIIEKDLCIKKIYSSHRPAMVFGWLPAPGIGAHQVFFQRQLAVETLSSHSEIDVDSRAP